jgi:AcrR family transcriptional regulator
MSAKPAGEVVADHRRDQMLAAAAEVIAERGFGETRISDVAERAGASPALVVYYFGTKDRLLSEALRYSEESFSSAVASELKRAKTMVKRLELLVELSYLPGADGHVPLDWGLWLDVWAQAFRNPEVKKGRIELDERWRAMIVMVVRQGIRAGEIADADAEGFAVAWAALLDGLSIQVVLEDPVVDARRAVEIAMRYAASELGFRWPA